MKTTRINYSVSYTLPDAPELSSKEQERLATHFNTIIEREIMRTLGGPGLILKRPTLDRSSFGFINLAAVS
jgi:hypothetical protein